jgi:hypothetical protein
MSQQPITHFFSPKRQAVDAEAAVDASSGSASGKVYSSPTKLVADEHVEATTQGGSPDASLPKQAQGANTSPASQPSLLEQFLPSNPHSSAVPHDRTQSQSSCEQIIESAPASPPIPTRINSAPSPNAAAAAAVPPPPASSSSHPPPVEVECLQNLNADSFYDQPLFLALLYFENAQQQQDLGAVRAYLHTQNVYAQGDASSTCGKALVNAAAAACGACTEHVGQLLHWIAVQAADAKQRLQAQPLPLLHQLLHPGPGLVTSTCAVTTRQCCQLLAGLILNSQPLTTTNKH